MKADALRKSILQLAVEGKLVPQEEKDSTIPLAEKKPKTPSFDIPKTWKWVELSSVATLLNGRAYSKEELLPQGDNRTPILRVGNLFTNSSWFYSDMDLPEQKYCTKGDLLFAWSASFGPKIWEGEKCIYHYHIWKIVCSKFVDKSWLYYLLLWMTEILKKTSGRGSTMVHITKRDTEKQILALPPVEEQRRIVQKLNELLPLVEVYGKEQEALLKLERELPGKLRASILQEAIQGKLVPQIDEEPSVEQIGEAPEEVPFAIPEKWKWIRIENLADVNPRVKPNSESDEVSFLPMTSVEAGYKNRANLSKTRVWSSVKNGYTKFANQDILLAKITPCFQNRKSVIVEGLTNGLGCGSSEFHVLRARDVIDSRYLLFFLKTDLFIQYGVEHFKGTAGQQRLGTKDLKDCFVPLPPLEEQKRIVNMVDILLSEVDRIGN